MSSKEARQVDQSEGCSLFPSLLKDNSMDEVTIRPKCKAFFKPLVGLEEVSAFDSSPDLCVRPRDKLYIQKQKTKAAQRLKSERMKKEKKKSASFSDSDSEFELWMQKAKSTTREKQQCKKHSKQLEKHVTDSHSVLFINSSEELFSSDSDLELVADKPTRQLCKKLNAINNNAKNEKISPDISPLNKPSGDHVESNGSVTTEMSNDLLNSTKVKKKGKNGKVRNDNNCSVSSSDLDENEWEAALTNGLSPGEKGKENLLKQRKNKHLSNDRRGGSTTEKSSTETEQKQLEVLDRVFFEESTDKVAQKRCSSELGKDRTRSVGLPRLKKPKVDKGNLSSSGINGSYANDSMTPNIHGGSLPADHFNSSVLEVPVKNSKSDLLADLSLLDLLASSRPSLSPTEITTAALKNRTSKVKKTDQSGSSVALKSDSVGASSSGVCNKTYVIKSNNEVQVDGVNVHTGEKDGNIKKNRLKKKANSPDTSSCSLSPTQAETSGLIPESAGIMSAGFRSALSMWEDFYHRQGENNRSSPPQQNPSQSQGSDRRTRSYHNKKKTVSATVTSEQNLNGIQSGSSNISTATHLTTATVEDRAYNRSTSKNKLRDNNVLDSEINQSIFGGDSLLCVSPLRMNERYSSPHENPYVLNDGDSTQHQSPRNWVSLDTPLNLNPSRQTSTPYSCDNLGLPETSTGRIGNLGSSHENNLTNSSVPRKRGSMGRKRVGKRSNRSKDDMTSGVSGSNRREAEEVICLDDSVLQAAGATGVSSTIPHLESDEAMARRLQEEMDHEYAQQMAQNPATPQANPPPRHSESNSNNTSALHKIGQMSPYVWNVHKNIFLGRDIPERPHNEPEKELHEILDNDVLAFLETSSPGTLQHVLNDDIPTRSQNPRNQTRQREERCRDSFEALSAVLGQFHRSEFSRNQDRLTELLTQTPDRSIDEALLPQLVDQLNSRRNNVEEPPVSLPIRQRGRRGETSRRRNRGSHDHVMNLFEDVVGPVRNPGRQSRHNNRNRDGHFYFPPLPTAIDMDDYEGLLELGERLGEVRQRGLSKREINRLPTTTFKHGDNNSTSAAAAPPECNICCCEFEDGEELRILPCFHNFHVACIDKWISANATCPVCRAEIKLS